MREDHRRGTAGRRRGRRQREGIKGKRKRSGFKETGVFKEKEQGK
jgi:hypothetical protein